MTDASQDSRSPQEVLSPGITAIVPARNEEAVIAGCVAALAEQPEISQIIVVNDQSTDKTAEIVRGVMAEIPRLRVLETREVPAGWVGKNNAVFLGASAAKTPWLLFTDADAALLPGAAKRALQIAQENDAALVSFSPEQITQSWYEKALIPFVYTRLAKHFSYEAVNNPKSKAAAANGQFLLIRRDAYEAVGGHASVAADVLEDVALARRAKAAGFRIWFGAGKGMVRARMYRSFGAMWEGWKKNLYLLVGASKFSVFREVESAIPWIPLLLLVVGLRFPAVMFVAVLFLLIRQFIYGMELSRNGYPFNLIIYYVPAVGLYAGVLWASYRAHAKGRVAWKGREVPVSVPSAPR